MILCDLSQLKKKVRVMNFSPMCTNNSVTLGGFNFPEPKLTHLCI
jgi:hypothetical protein